MNVPKLADEDKDARLRGHVKGESALHGDEDEDEEMHDEEEDESAADFDDHGGHAVDRPGAEPRRSMRTRTNISSTMKQEKMQMTQPRKDKQSEEHAFLLEM